MLNAFTYTHEVLLIQHLVSACPHNSVVAMLMDVLMRNCMHRHSASEMERLSWTHDLIWSVWDRAAVDAKDLFEVAEVYMSCLTMLRTCLMFEPSKEQNIYGLWPAVGCGRLDCLQIFWNQVHGKIEARNCDTKVVEEKIQEMVESGGSGGDRDQQRLAERMNGMREEICRLGIMEHMCGMVMELIKEKNRSGGSE